jgi:hypothetical protein
MANEPLYQKLSAHDEKALGTTGRIARAFAIKNGTAYEFNGWGPAIAKRVAVKARPVVKANAKHPIAPADYEHLSLNDRLARAYAAKEGTPWTPKGYADTAFVQRVAVRPGTVSGPAAGEYRGRIGQVLVPTR